MKQDKKLRAMGFLIYLSMLFALMCFGIEEARGQRLNSYQLLITVNADEDSFTDYSVTLIQGKKRRKLRGKSEIEKYVEVGGFNRPKDIFSLECPTGYLLKSSYSPTRNDTFQDTDLGTRIVFNESRPWQSSQIVIRCVRK